MFCIDPLQRPRLAYIHTYIITRMAYLSSFTYQKRTAWDILCSGSRSHLPSERVLVVLSHRYK